MNRYRIPCEVLIEAETLSGAAKMAAHVAIDLAVLEVAGGLSGCPPGPPTEPWKGVSIEIIPEHVETLEENI